MVTGAGACSANMPFCRSGEQAVKKYDLSLGASVRMLALASALGVAKLLRPVGINVDDRESASQMTFEMPGTCSVTMGGQGCRDMSKANSLAMMPAALPEVLSRMSRTRAE